MRRGDNPCSVTQLITAYFCAWPQNPLLSLPLSQQLSYKPRNGKHSRPRLGKEKQEKSCIPDKIWKGQLLGGVSSGLCYRGSKLYTCTSQPRDIGHHGELLWLACMCPNVLRGICPQKASRELTWNFPCKIWLMKTHKQSHLHLHVI